MEVSVNGSRCSACHVWPSCNEYVSDPLQWVIPQHGLQAPALIKADKRWLKRCGLFWWNLCFISSLGKTASSEFCLTAPFHIYDSLARWVRHYPSWCPEILVVLNGEGFISHLQQTECSKASSSEYRCVKHIVTLCSCGFGWAWAAGVISVL